MKDVGAYGCRLPCMLSAWKLTLVILTRVQMSK